jgi:hypothetical protein
VTGGDPGRHTDRRSPRDVVTGAADITARGGASSTRRGGVGADFTVFRQRILAKCEPQLRALAAQLVAPEALTPWTDASTGVGANCVIGG